MEISIRHIIVSPFIIWIFGACLALLFLLPLRKSLRFGIDLVGGTYITLDVQVDKAVESELVSQLHALTTKFQSTGLAIPTRKQVDKGNIVLTFDSIIHAQDAVAVIKKEFKNMIVEQEKEQLRISFSAKTIENIKREAVQRNIDVLRVRLNPLSVSEITIAAQGEKSIIIELPDVSDPLQAKAMIGKAAVLEFKLVERVGRTAQDILYELDGELPGDKEILPGKEINGIVEQYYLVPKFAEVTGSSLHKAYPYFNSERGEVVVVFEFAAQAGDVFYQLTSKNIGKPLAIVLDGIVISAPNVKEGIRSQGTISGNFKSDEAKELALLLRSGSFVAPVTFEEERQIGPSLGYEAIRQGLISCVVSLALLFLFSIFYYKYAGLLAFITLVYNLLLILVGMALFKATLTLPGIAGIVLTLGMAIDASILIFERMKEELKKGLSLKRTIQDSFSDVFMVILDANITTFIVGAVLYKFGTGPIQGFAVTMMLGIISTLITGLFFLKSLFYYTINNLNVQNLKI